VSLKEPGNCFEMTFSLAVGVSSANSAARGVSGVKMGVPEGTEWTMWMMLDAGEEESAEALR
jgi:hypothetical protein